MPDGDDGRWIVLAEHEVNDPARPDVLCEILEHGHYEPRDDANELAIVLSRRPDVMHSLIGDCDLPSLITGEPHTLVAMYVDGRRYS